MPRAQSLQTFISLARTSDPAVKPAFIAIGDVEDFEVTSRPTYKSHSGPTAVGRRRKYMVPIGAEIDIAFTVTEMSGATWERMWLAAPLNMTGNQTYSPLGAGEPWQGFVRLTQKDGSGSTRNTVDVFCALTVDPVRMGPDEISVSFKGEVYESALNTGTLTNLL